MLHLLHSEATIGFIYKRGEGGVKMALHLIVFTILESLCLVALATNFCNLLILLKTINRSSER